MNTDSTDPPTAIEATPVAVNNEENFRLVRSFNDIFVALASILVLVALVIVLNPILSDNEIFLSADSWSLLLIPMACVSWGLAEYFTRIRHMALPSILYALVFVYSLWLLVFVLGLLASYSVQALNLPSSNASVGHASSFIGVDSHEGSLAALVASIIGVLAAWLFWWRFHVAITVAIFATNVIMCVVFCLAWISSDFTFDWLEWILACCGIVVLVSAVYWDRRDLSRETHESDVAFWLHVLGALLIVHPFFITVLDFDAQSITLLEAASVVLTYLLLGVVALILNRRAILVSSLIYVISAIGAAFVSVGANFAYALLIMGLLLLSLSVWWSAIRSFLLQFLPESIRSLLPQ